MIWSVSSLRTHTQYVLQIPADGCIEFLIIIILQFNRHIPNTEEIFTSLQFLQVYYSPLWLVPLPRFPAVRHEYPPVHIEHAEDPGAAAGRLARLRYQKDFTLHWASACQLLPVAGILRLAQKIPLRRVRWVVCHCTEYSDDFDVIVRRDEGRIVICGGFIRSLPPDASRWEWFREFRRL